MKCGTAHYKVGFNGDGNINAIRIDVHQKSGIPIVEKFIESLKTPNIFCTRDSFLLETGLTRPAGRTVRPTALL